MGGFGINQNSFLDINKLMSSTNRSGGSGLSGIDMSIFTQPRLTVRDMRNMLKMEGIDTRRPNSSNSTTSKKDDAATLELKKDATELKDAAKALMTGGTDSPFKSLSGTSSNTDAVSDIVSKGMSAQGKKPDMELSVSQLAEAQKNNSNVMNSKDLASLGEGTYTFELEYAGNKKSISFSLTDKDNNYTMQKKIAEAVNNSKMGVTATVNATDKQSFLRFEANTTGETNKDGKANTFQFTDKYGGKTVSSLGMNQVVQNAQNAVYEVNGVQKESTSNHVQLDYGTTAQLKKVTEDPVTITFGYNKEDVSKKLSNFVSSYNDMLSTLNGTNSRTEEYASQLESITSIHSKRLSEIGIKVGFDGKLSIDSEVLKKADMKKVENLFSGVGSYADSIAQKATTIVNKASSLGSNQYGLYNSNSNYYNSYMSGGMYTSWF